MDNHSFWWWVDRYPSYKRYTLCDHMSKTIDQRTPYFIDRERHNTWPEYPYNLYGSGMHPSGCAAHLGRYHTLKEAKEAAIKLSA